MNNLKDYKVWKRLKIYMTQKIKVKTINENRKKNNMKNDESKQSEAVSNFAHCVSNFVFLIEYWICK